MGELPAPAGSVLTPITVPSRAWLWFLAGASLAAAAYFAFQPAPGDRPDAFTNAMYAGLGLAAATAVLVGIAKHRPQARGAWYLVATGLGVSICGDALYDLVRGTSDIAPFPSFADVIYLTSYGLYTVSLLWLVRVRYPGGRGLAMPLDAFIIAVGAGLLAWAFLIEPYASSPDLSVMAKLVATALPLTDVVLLAVVVRLVDAEADGQGRYPASLKLIAVALIGSFTADIAYGLGSLGGNYQAGTPIDLGFLTAYACWGAAALHPSMRRLSEPQPNRPTRLTPPRIGLLLAVALLAPTLLAVQALRGRSFSFWFLVVGVVILFVLVLVRFAGLAGAEAARADAQERLLDRIVQATEEERSRLAADLHDGPIQRLAGVSYTAELVRRRLERGQAGSGRQLLDTLSRQVGAEIDALRRLMSELRPPVLDEWGLQAALSQCAADFRRRTGIVCTVDASAPRLDPSRETVLYRVVQEALVNVSKHAGARNVWISLAVVDRTARLEVHDDGIGFDVDRTGDLLDGSHFGLVGMRQRVGMAGGTLDVRSRPGQGTVIRASLPLPPNGVR